MTEPTDVVVEQNKQLRQQVKALQARVAAFESSRWWRLHPRLTFARLRSLPIRAKANEAPKHDDERSFDDLTMRFRQEVIARGNFSEDWFTTHIPAWEPVLSELDGRQSRLLELGSFEGMSSCFLLWRLRDAHLTCVDTFGGRSVWAAYGIPTANLETTFDRNVSLVDAGRVRKLVGNTRDVLPKLVAAGEQFDFVYIDASHRALDALVDAALTWQVLAQGGLAIFDDYGAIPLGEDPMLRPVAAIDAFVSVVRRELEIVSSERQLIVRKIA